MAKNTSTLVMKMSRIRYIKPQFFQHEGLYDAELESGLSIRLAFAGLWTCCDKHGRFEWKPRTLKLKILPWDAVDFGKILEVLEKGGWVVPYEIGGERFGYIPSWKKHQWIGKAEQGTKFSYPTPPGQLDSDCEEAEAEVPEPGQNGCPTVEQPFEGRKVMDNANGNGKINGKRVMPNANGEAAPQPGNPQSHSLIEHTSSALDSRNQQPHSKPSPAPNENSADDLDDLYLAADPAELLAEIFFQSLPSEAQQAAPRTWKNLWAEDFSSLLRNEEFDLIKDTIRFARASRWSKYCVRAKTFVEKFPEISQDWQKIMNKNAKAARS